MDVATVLRDARRRAGLSQRELSIRTGVAQPTIARIERSLVDPRTGTLHRLLAACDHELSAIPMDAGTGVDRTQIRTLLQLTPVERLHTLVGDVHGLRRLEAARRR